MPVITTSIRDRDQAELAEANNPSPSGPFRDIGGERFYLIEKVDQMPPFLMNLVSSSDQWMFLGSNGSVTAGRRDPDNALFPYVTQDKLFDTWNVTGSVTAIQVDESGKSALWEPFASIVSESGIQRNLYKNGLGTKARFEETHGEFELRFIYEWTFSPRFGFVRSAVLENLGSQRRRLRVLDGLQNLLPYGLDQAFVNQFSNLADAYKKGEWIEDAGIGVYYLSSIPTDKAEPSEGLKATVAWSPQRDGAKTLLCSEQLRAFREGRSLQAEADIRGRRCAFLQERSFELSGKGSREWKIVTDINQDACAIEALRRRLATGELAAQAVDDDIERNARALVKKIARADGLQKSGNALRDLRHQSNALFNIMRGGVFDGGYEISVADFEKHLLHCNRNLWTEVRESLSELGDRCSLFALRNWLEGQRSDDLTRIGREYLPLSFSRRHGDPSRPWNRFSINTEDEDGNPILSYQGNWRDIFQNWEPLGYSFPGYLKGMISRFLNVSTADGYNPYRVTRDGFDWEVIEPDEPWSNIGYWGDHQVVYLLKLLEASEKFFPGELARNFGDESYVYAHVPYKIRSFEQILADPRSTVDYDEEAAEELLSLADTIGSDGKLLRDANGHVVSATLLEKLLAPLLAKLSNFIPDGGIWMNTQRPEWNDANNALVGYGVSVVTLCYTYRYVNFLEGLLEGRRPEDGCQLNALLAEQLASQSRIFEAYATDLDKGFDAKRRFALMRELGESSSAFRSELYGKSFSAERQRFAFDYISNYLSIAKRFLAASIDGALRDDGLAQSYRLLSFDAAAQEAAIEELPEMLEGQVAMLSSGRLTLDQVDRLAHCLRKSALYREDVRSYMLYPDRQLPRFLEKNRLSPEQVSKSRLLRQLAEDGEKRILKKDTNGDFRFNGRFRNSADLREALAALKGEEDVSFEAQEIEDCVSVFEEAFDHRRFLGRSGTFFAYEGLGSIYWHMVSKLILALQENCQRFADQADGGAYRRLKDAYYETQAGLGLDKSARAYGAFPIDAYSHTPRHAGAQQPGMTGQVKEDLLVRWRELGIALEEGRISCKPELLREDDFLSEPTEFTYVAANGSSRSVTIPAGSFALTLCQCLFIVTRSGRRMVKVFASDGATDEVEGATLDSDRSASVFRREGTIERIEFII
ncbi:hypothetical protein [Pelagicoccus sp. SDUM812003]|uniref:hypothetical protein n=1 Tax=Pelagicoccus sp. SDUM812003 TaxID=3041267 RepID=UPI00280F24CA|nr:hypothetical protein [Pelagicoccus sp. SDUM812003]MDQ8201842.1 hypothetical protein [Pelagicoccus sp. SDUM812003]